MFKISSSRNWILRFLILVSSKINDVFPDSWLDNEMVVVVFMTFSTEEIERVLKAINSSGN